MTTQKARDEKRAVEYCRTNSPLEWTLEMKAAYMAGIRAERRRITAAVKDLEIFYSTGTSVCLLSDVLKAIKGDRG